MTLLVTRPQPQADAWVTDLRSHGVEADALPLIGIEAPAQPQAVTALWQDLGAHRLVMFVSPAAVSWFFRLRPEGAPWPHGCLAATPGPGTAQALLHHGRGCGLNNAAVITPARQAAQFDSEHLWPLLADLEWSGQRVAIVGGGDQLELKGRTWLAEQWRARGAQVEPVLAYRRGPGCWDAAQRALADQALHRPGEHAWLFSSSQAIVNLIDHHLPASGLQASDWAAHHALVTHPRIAQEAARIGIGHVEVVRPTLEAVVQARRAAL